MNFYEDGGKKKVYIVGVVVMLVLVIGIIISNRDGEKMEDGGSSLVERVEEKPTDKDEYVEIKQEIAPTTMRGVIGTIEDRTSEIEYKLDIGGNERGIVVKRGVVYFDGATERVVGPNAAVAGKEMTIYGRGDVKTDEYEVEAIVLGDEGVMKYGVIESIQTNGKESMLKIAGMPEYVRIPEGLEIREGLSESVMEFHNNIMEGSRVFYTRAADIKSNSDGTIEYTAEKVIIVE